MKRLAAPKHWMLSKLGGVWAPRPSTGPHKLRECIPLVILLRNRLKYALNRRECISIVMQRLVSVDGRVRTDVNFPAGFMDVVQIKRTGDQFRLLYDVKGRFTIHRIPDEEAAFKLCKIVKIEVGKKGVPFLVTHDGRTIRYPDPSICVNDSVKIDLASGKVVEHFKFEAGAQVMITGGANIGRVGAIAHRERHPSSFDIVYVRDKAGHMFSTRLANIFLIGKEGTPAISLPKGEGVRGGALGEKK
eukprot:TRINITY_DN39_c0_g1_i2.p1 TRINITY_DN39_c0_g1~~TRINITY_DN39_c0_g1_i2.p1  ORF type:complete len:246 (-),score=62.77 TRINITY_DN39_c0_g1_i2:86-823(-)